MKTGVVSHALLFIFFCYLQLYLRNYLYRGLIAVLYHHIYFLVLKYLNSPHPTPYLLSGVSHALLFIFFCYL